MSSSRAGIDRGTVTVYMAGIKRVLSFPATGILRSLKVAAQSGFNICGDGMVLIPDGATAEPAPSIKLSALRGMRFRLCPKPGAKYVEVYNARGARAEFCCYGMSFLDLRRDAARLHGVKGEVTLCELVAIGKPGVVVINTTARVTTGRVSSYVIIGVR